MQRSELPQMRVFANQVTYCNTLKGKIHNMALTRIVTSLPPIADPLVPNLLGGYCTYPTCSVLIKVRREQSYKISHQEGEDSPTPNSPPPIADPLVPDL